MNLEIFTLRAKQILPYIDELARLRVAVFKDFPFLYEGSMEYERAYLKKFIDAPDSVFVLARDALSKEIVGASTGCLLSSEKEEVQAPFTEKGFNIDHFYYFSESVLLRHYRGKGAGKTFFKERENVAKQFPQVKQICFCTVVRENNHPKQPKDYHSLEKMWENLGYQKTDIFTSFDWREIGDTLETNHPMVFWIKNL